MIQFSFSYQRCIIVTFEIKIRVRLRLEPLKFGRLQIRIRLGL